VVDDKLAAASGPESGGMIAALEVHRASRCTVNVFNLVYYVLGLSVLLLY
jgi:hypothetical protein